VIHSQDRGFSYLCRWRSAALELRAKRRDRDKVTAELASWKPPPKAIAHLWISYMPIFVIRFLN
jgi:hypothetical protein